MMSTSICLPNRRCSLLPPKLPLSRTFSMSNAQLTLILKYLSLILPSKSHHIISSISLHKFQYPLFGYYHTIHQIYKFAKYITIPLYRQGKRKTPVLILYTRGTVPGHLEKGYNSTKCILNFKDTLNRA